MDWTRQSRFSDPGQHAALLSTLPDGIAVLREVVSNLLVHYRASGIDFPPDRLTEINSRWVWRMLDVDQARGSGGLAVTRDPVTERVVGCCRDAALFTVAALRAKGVAARTQVGFADYLASDYHVDHVVAEFHDEQWWVVADTQVGLDSVVLGPGGLRTAAQVWTAYRRGEIDPDRYGVAPGLGLGGPAMIARYVLFEVTHRYGDELLLRDFWGEPALALADDLATLLLTADADEPGAEALLEKRYRSDSRLHPGATVLTVSPAGGYPTLTSVGAPS